MSEHDQPEKKKRKPATPQPSAKTIKASVVVDVPLNIRWTAAAALAGMDKSRFAALAIEDACKGIVLFDRRKKSKSVDSNDRLDEADEISDPAEEAA